MPAILLSDQSSYYSCSKVYFEPGSIPFSKAHAGISVFSSDSMTKDHFAHAIWPTEYTDFGKQKLSNVIIKVTGVISNSARLGDLFILSIFERLLNIITSSAKLYVDRTKWHHIMKPGYAVDSISDAILQLTPLGNLCNL
jgi:hypothetical protein